VAISGWILDPDRKKMSKSKGNTVVPTEPLDEFGPDAVRYWAASARLGVDTAIDSGVFKEGKRLVTKMRNAGRLVQNYEGEGGEPEQPLDRALIARLRALVDTVTASWEDWDHAGALAATESWFWGDFCDNYLELSKTRSYAGDPSAIGTLRIALDVVVRLFAPVLPYITEEIHNAGSEEPSSVHRAAWPTVVELPAAEDDGSFEAGVAVLTKIRKAKSEAKVSLRIPVERAVVRGSKRQLDLFSRVQQDVASTVNVQRFELVTDDKSEELAVTVELGEPEPKR